MKSKKKPEEPDWSKNDGFKEVTFAGISRNVPIATEEQNQYIEELLHYKCDYWIAKIPELGIARLSVLLFNRLMSLDMERAIVPGQVPHRIYSLSKEFREWENHAFDLIEKREEELGISTVDYVYRD